jgi:hypothetical protein
LPSQFTLVYGPLTQIGAAPLGFVFADPPQPNQAAVLCPLPFPNPRSIPAAVIYKELLHPNQLISDWRVFNNNRKSIICQEVLTNFWKSFFGY